jgi:hypothetical protein
MERFIGIMGRQTFAGMLKNQGGNTPLAEIDYNSTPPAFQVLDLPGIFWLLLNIGSCLLQEEMQPVEVVYFTDARI